MTYDPRQVWQSWDVERRRVASAVAQLSRVAPDVKRLDQILAARRSLHHYRTEVLMGIVAGDEARAATGAREAARCAQRLFHLSNLAISDENARTADAFGLLSVPATFDS